MGAFQHVNNMSKNKFFMFWNYISEKELKHGYILIFFFSIYIEFSDDNYTVSHLYMLSLEARYSDVTNSK